MGFYNQCNYKANTTYVIGAGAVGDIGFSKNDFWAADDCFPIVCSPALNDRYAYHFLLSKQQIIYGKVRRGSIHRLSRQVIEDIDIPVHPLEVQREIVRILDNFTELTAELTARKKQYEYYRDRLFGFDKTRGVIRANCWICYASQLQMDPILYQHLLSLESRFYSRNPVNAQVL